jgi:hypothetical protein
MKILRTNFSEKKLHEKFCGRISARKKLHENAADEFQREKKTAWNFLFPRRNEKIKIKFYAKSSVVFSH